MVFLAFRNAGRCLLLLAILACALPSGSGSLLWRLRGLDYPDPEANPRGAAGAILSRAIQFDTSNPPGNERPLAEYLVGILAREGLEARVIETPSDSSSVRRAAAWARYPGNGRRRPIVLLSHLDVVPADESQWVAGPFEGVIAGDTVVGRGALDAKGIAVVHLLALVKLRRGLVLDRDVIFLATPDEENGGREGARYLAQERSDLLRGAEFLLTEGGGILTGEGKAPDLWGVTFTEKSPCWIELITKGAPGHGSSAASDAAVPRLITALDRVRRMEMEIHVTPEAERMFAALAPFAPPEDRASFEDLGAALRTNPRFRERFLSEPRRAALVRDTVSITVLEGSARTNVVPAQARAHLDARLLPGESCEDFIAKVRRVVADPQATLKPLLSFEAGGSPIETDLFRAIEAAAARSDSPSIVVPQMIAGFTDAHHFRDLGIVAYGFVPRRLRPHETRGIHAPNERISLDNLELGIDAMVEILEELSGDVVECSTSRACPRS
jgi:acetylornithine deacetylase/succinyl-diaminopimelate desuccinylase-like protein